METVRPARADDLDDMVRLASLAHDELRNLRGGGIWARREARPMPPGPSLCADMANREALVSVGAFDDVVVGYAVVRSEPLADGRLLGVVSDIVVEDGARGVGVGAALIAVCLDWCRARHCVGVDALALPGARETKNFFEMHGFSARSLTLHHRLEPS